MLKTGFGKKSAHMRFCKRTKDMLISFSVEKGADNLIAKLLDINAKAKKTEELLDAIEKER